MNVTVENLAPCKKLVRVEVEPQAVDAAFEKATSEFHRHAKLPGFRPGKVPRDHVARIYAKEIEQEVKKSLVPDSFWQAVKEQKLRVISKPDIEEIQFGRGKPLQFAANIETAPDFELPDYKNLPVRISSRAVTQNDLDRALTVLREKRATYLDVSRPTQRGDFVVVNYTGTCEGKPITELAPAARGLAEHKNFWLQMEPDSFLPSFTEQLEGASVGEKRTVTVTFPVDFPEKAVAGKMGVYEVEILQVKERRLPELDDHFAKAYGAESMDKLRDGVREDLRKDLNHKQSVSIREQVLRALSQRVTCDLPESIVLAETKDVVMDIVRENQQRGITKEAIDEKKDEIYNYATATARERIKMAFIFGRIAEQENIKASDEEIRQQILALAKQNQIAPDKLTKQLKERGAISQIENQIVQSKVIDFLQLHAKVEEDPSATGI